MPDQLKLPFYLWTREAVAQLIKREYGIAVSATTVGRYLKAWGMSAQKPVRRAYERNDAAIARWLEEEYPAIVKEARRERATIYWGDEMGLRSDHLSGTCFAPTGQTPVVRATGQRFGCNMNSAITNRGKLAFMVFEGKFQSTVFIEFMRRLLRQTTGKLYLIVDGHPVHRSAAAKKFVADSVRRLRLIRLPGYCPELNPDELLNQDVKTNALGKTRPTNKAEMLASLRIPTNVTGCTEERDRYGSADAWCSDFTAAGHDEPAQGCPQASASAPLSLAGGRLWGTRV
jgi:transposase